jgi:hypothetical protein
MKHGRRLFLIAAGGLLLTPIAWQRYSKGDVSAVEEEGTDLVISPEHLSCIRQLRFIWIPNVESGGPAVDPQAPFGSADAYKDLAEIAPSKSRSELKRLYGEVMRRLPVFTGKATLGPGRYVLPRPAVLHLKQFMKRGDAGMEDGGSFDFTAEHAKLIAAIRWWYEEGPRFSFVFDPGLDIQYLNGAWRAATVNFKRPFGDMTYFEIDMTRILGASLKPNSKDPEEDRLFALYQQMHAALQVFVMHATL